ncbi:ribosomal large subunit pseudouridine synthase B [Buchnera aphidicola BCc]|uniref:Pseudouridine synthase n=1 Tax=Buchnera aphidicola subsp. Cinara cedri (strain Cc) TaxID=372461 RepID=Q057Q3_BUCCC|nr:ribosomal large subunit pseudouridine synthase B [Buchnera aphidicola BCc]
MAEKIQKILSNCGVDSRRNIEKHILNKSLKINGKIVHIGERFLKKNIKSIFLKKKKIFIKNEKTKILIYHKPVGEICTKKDQYNRITVFKKLPKLFFSKWISIGRLDINTSGLLLFTNFGELAHRLMHPSYRIKREYLVCVLGKILKKKILLLKKGILINNSISKFHEIIFLKKKKKNQWFKVSLFQGKNREVRLLWNAINIKVNRLIRIKFGIITLPKFLKSGCFFELSYQKTKNILSLVNL